MAIMTVIYKASFKTRLDACDNALVDAALTLFTPSSLNVDVEQFLPIDNRNAQFFLMRCIK